MGFYAHCREFGVDTEFLERRELQLLTEAATYPTGSPTSRHLLRLCDRLCEAALRIEEARAPGLPSVRAPALNPWCYSTNETEPQAVEFFQK
jgi:hypothetical protein